MKEPPMFAVSPFIVLRSRRRCAFRSSSFWFAAFSACGLTHLYSSSCMKACCIALHSLSKAMKKGVRLVCKHSCSALTAARNMLFTSSFGLLVLSMRSPMFSSRWEMYSVSWSHTIPFCLHNHRRITGWQLSISRSVSTGSSVSWLIQTKPRISRGIPIIEFEVIRPKSLPVANRYVNSTPLFRFDSACFSAHSVTRL